VPATYDLAIIGGGINGCGIARDAAGRGLAVHLCEMGDLAGGTSSRSTGLIHGGLRYLEHYDFRLVREALREREVLWRIAPHIVRPLRFVLPIAPACVRPGCCASGSSSTTIWADASFCRLPASSTSRAIPPVPRSSPAFSGRF
jgi:glycerol-3-phosphate dehydrogenase